MSISSEDHLKEVVGLRNDFVFRVFVCPECRTEVTISRYQVEGERPVMCARCNAKWEIHGPEIADLNDSNREFMGYKVFIKLDDSQRQSHIPDTRPANAEGVSPKAAAAKDVVAKAAALSAKKPAKEPPAAEAAPPASEKTAE